MSGSLLLGLVVILAGAYVFTNGVEWMGKRFQLSEGIVGSVLAGVGTAMPETMVPVMAIFFGEGEDRIGVGIGAILGAPFMLACLTMPLLGLGVLFFAYLGKRDREMDLHPPLIRMDLGFFLGCYSFALVLGLLPIQILGQGSRTIAALLLMGLYAVYLRRLSGLGETVGENIPPLILSRNNTPSTALILVQAALGLGFIIGGAHVFVNGIQEVARIWAVSPLLFSLLVTPIATELPEKINSLIWIAKRKDRLAVANITGAMVFQSTFPVAVGLLGTSWQLDRFSLASGGLALSAGILLYIMLIIRGHWRPHYLLACLAFYILFILYLVRG